MTRVRSRRSRSDAKDSRRGVANHRHSDQQAPVLRRPVRIRPWVFESAIEEIEKKGLFPQITVVKNDRCSEEDPRYDVVHGRQYARAAMKLGWITVPAVVRSKEDLAAEMQDVVRYVQDFRDRMTAFERDEKIERYTWFYEAIHPDWMRSKWRRQDPDYANVFHPGPRRGRSPRDQLLDLPPGLQAMQGDERGPAQDPRDRRGLRVEPGQAVSDAEKIKSTRSSILSQRASVSARRSGTRPTTSRGTRTRHVRSRRC